MTLLKSAEVTLEAAGVHRPRWTAQQLLSHRLGCAPIDLWVEPPPLEPAQRVRFEADAAARAAGVPLQYLLGSTEFYGREFLVGPGVFIPRPETEILIDVVLDVIARPEGSKQSRFLDRDCFVLLRSARSPRNDEWVVVDVGTGCGAIAITLALGQPHLQVTAVDRSAPALANACENGVRLGARVRWIQGDLLTGMKEGSVDAVTANLPYLDPAESSAWPRELHWEPWVALDGGAGGLSLIRRFLPEASRVLRPEGIVFLEIGAGQAEAVGRLAKENGFRVEEIVPDLGGLERVVVLKKAENLKGSDPSGTGGG